ncbi:LPP20 family lipoprotein [Desulfonatronum sp. SC1]|uniref:LPP20 family lipoprotein n=1 Tax=Desulfonatronum sp. SC1 TaxID=2109626 RepID=UPI000D300A50|nr:LPP20 family lipoprotein [Desulfonatronum sp. SC1]PTN38675.1 hypothetical protein C6366_01695 [Desulfonatronum sp. SC1]
MMESNAARGGRFALIGWLLLCTAAFVVSVETCCLAQVDPQSRLMARRAAKADALRNLLEQVYGLRVDATTTVRDFVLQSDVIRTRVSAVIQGAEEVDYYEHPDGTAEVTVSLLLGPLEDVLGRRVFLDGLVVEATGYGAPRGAAGSGGGGQPVGSWGDVLRAEGYGLPPNDPNMHSTERQLLARRAAQADAMRNLAERVNGVQVTGDTIVQDFMTRSDTVRTRVRAFVQNARIVSEQPMADGGYQVEVEMELEPLRQFFNTMRP